MKKYYIEPELQVVVCKMSTTLLSTSLDPLETDPVVTPDPDPYEGEFSGHEFDFEDDLEFDDEY